VSQFFFCRFKATKSDTRSVSATCRFSLRQEMSVLPLLSLYFRFKIFALLQNETNKTVIVAIIRIKISILSLLSLYFRFKIFALLQNEKIKPTLSLLFAYRMSLYRNCNFCRIMSLLSLKIFRFTSKVKDINTFFAEKMPLC